MSQVKISGDPSGSGIFTISAPSSSTNRALVLPDNSGTILTTATAGVPVNGPAFSAYQNSAQAFSSAVSTKILFQVESFDTNNSFASSRFTPTVAGYYFLQFSFLPPSVSRTAEIQLTFAVNNVFIHSGFDVNGGATASVIICSTSALIYLNGTTDYVEAFAYCGTGGTTGPTGQYTQFQGFLARSAT